VRKFLAQPFFFITAGENRAFPQPRLGERGEGTPGGQPGEAEPRDRPRARAAPSSSHENPGLPSRASRPPPELGAELAEGSASSQQRCPVTRHSQPLATFLRTWQRAEREICGGDRTARPWTARGVAGSSLSCCSSPERRGLPSFSSGPRTATRRKGQAPRYSPQKRSQADRGFGRTPNSINLGHPKSNNSHSRRDCLYYEPHCTGGLPIFRGRYRYNRVPDQPKQLF